MFWLSGTLDGAEDGISQPTLGQVHGSNARDSWLVWRKIVIASYQVQVVGVKLIITTHQCE